MERRKLDEDWGTVWYVVGELGAVTFILDGHGPEARPRDYGFHHREGPSEHEHQGCEFLDGDTCYYSGSSLSAIALYHDLIQGGEEAVWANLEYAYRRWINREVDCWFSTITRCR
jgi:hypothetical protein